MPFSGLHPEGLEFETLRAHQKINDLDQSQKLPEILVSVSSDPLEREKEVCTSPGSGIPAASFGGRGSSQRTAVSLGFTAVFALAAFFGWCSARAAFFFGRAFKALPIKAAAEPERHTSPSQ